MNRSSHPVQEEPRDDESRRSAAFESHRWVSAHGTDICGDCGVDINDDQADERCVATLNECD